MNHEHDGSKDPEQLGAMAEAEEFFDSLTPSPDTTCPTCGDRFLIAGMCVVGMKDEQIVHYHLRCVPRRARQSEAQR